jgi:excisionase family DNA binding protein
MHRRFQFGMRENPASSRRHGSRSEPVSLSIGSCTQNPPSSDLALAGAYTGANATPHGAATTEEREDSRLLTIQQVAEILHVPVSWVYGRTRERSSERLPGIRLGKYWRFREEEIHAWVENQRGGRRAP